jgi:hypothetical protein
MSSSRHNIPRFPATPQAAEIYRDALGMVVHDLGGISSALALRADALRPVVPANEVEALHGLTEQLRDVMRLLRTVLGPRGDSLIAPSRRTPADEWWRLTSRLLSASLPRAVRITQTLAPVTLTPTASSLFANLMMLACRDLVARGLVAPATLHVTIAAVPSPSSDAAGDIDRACVTLDIASPTLPLADRVIGGWQRSAARLARRGRADMQWWTADGDRERWQCSVA